MNQGFNNEIKQDLNSLSALAVDDAPIDIRLQKLLTNVCEILQVPAAILMLTPEFSLQPGVLVAGSDNDLTEKLNSYLLQKESEQYFTEIFANEAFVNYKNENLIHQDAGRLLGQGYEFLIVPLLAGTQKIGALLLVNSGDQVVDKKQTIFYIVVEQVCLLLLLFRAANRESLKISKLSDKDWVTEKFLATLSHELRTPLHAILGWANLLQHPSMNKELRSQALKTIERNARAQNFIINELLDASYSFNNQVPLNKRPVLITSILHQVVKLLRGEAEQKGVSFSVNIQDSSDYVMADPERLSQVFWHLIANAIKFTADHGTINLGSRQVSYPMFLILFVRKNLIQPASLEDLD
jgi:signal transduction histidine kinase